MLFLRCAIKNPHIPPPERTNHANVSRIEPCRPTRRTHTPAILAAATRTPTRFMRFTMFAFQSAQHIPESRVTLRILLFPIWTTASDIPISIWFLMHMKFYCMSQGCMLWSLSMEDEVSVGLGFCKMISSDS